MPSKTISRAKEVLAKLEQYELAVFAGAKEKINFSDSALARAGSGKTTSQFSLFAISNENVIDELRKADFEKMSGGELKQFFHDIRKRIV